MRLLQQMVRELQQMVRFLKHLVRGKNNIRCEKRQHLVRKALSPLGPWKTTRSASYFKGLQEKTTNSAVVLPGLSPRKNYIKCEFCHENEPLNATWGANLPLKTTFGAKISLESPDKLQQKVRETPDQRRKTTFCASRSGVCYRKKQQKVRGLT